MGDVRVGFIGLGNIGAPMAMRLADWPGGLVVYDVSPSATAPFAERSATIAASPAEVGGTADVICVMVRDDAQVDEVVAGANGVLRTASPGTVIAIHSTIAAETAVRLAELAAASGVAVVDAAVTGGPDGAAQGTLAVMVGGDAAAVERVRGPLERFASLVGTSVPWARVRGPRSCAT